MAINKVRVPHWQFEITVNKIRAVKNEFMNKYNPGEHDRSDNTYHVPEKFGRRHLIKTGALKMRQEKDIRKRLTYECSPGLTYEAVFDVEHCPAYQHGCKIIEYIKQARKEISNHEYNVEYECKEHPEKASQAIEKFAEYIDERRRKIIEMEAAEFPAKEAA